MFECNTGLECEECEKAGGCKTHLEHECVCGKKILISEHLCHECTEDFYQEEIDYGDS